MVSLCFHSKIPGSRLFASVSQLAKLAVSPNEPLDVSDPEVASHFQLPKICPATAKQTTRLANGLTVTTIEQHGPVSTIHIALQAGSRYETAATRGASQVLKNLQFKASERRSAIRLTRELENAGVLYDVSLDREFLSLSATALRDHVPEALEVIADGIHSPSFDEHDVCMSIEEAIHQSDCTPLKMLALDSMHLNAYRGSGLANALYASPAQLKKLCANDIEAFWQKTISPQRSTVIGVNIHHGTLLALLQKDLGPHIWTNSASDKIPTNTSPATFCPGGQSSFESLENDTNTIFLGFNSLPWVSTPAELASLFVLQHLLGHRQCNETKMVNSTRLAQGTLISESIQSTQFLTKTPPVNATQHFYSDNGLFVLEISAENNRIADAACQAVASLKNAGQSISEESLSRAKNACQNQLASLSSCRSWITTFNAKSSLFPKKNDNLELMEHIAKVDSALVKNTVQKLLKQRPVASGFGDIYALPSLDMLKL